MIQRLDEDVETVALTGLKAGLPWTCMATTQAAGLSIIGDYAR